jgi:hypothetical protein
MNANIIDVLDAIGLALRTVAGSCCDDELSATKGVVAWGCLSLNGRYFQFFIFSRCVSG